MLLELMGETILKVKGLVRHFGAVKAVDGIDFELKAGQVVGFIGANGAGKTTTMRLLTTLDLPDSGEIIFDGVDLMQYPEAVKPRIGWMPDGFDPVAGTTVEDYIDFFARAYGLTGKARVDEVARVLEFCGITELKDRYINKMSKGQTQRMSLARMLIGNPDFLVMDEPAAGLDPQARLEFKQLVRSLREQGKTMLISSHILSELGEMCDTLIFMDQGRIIRTGSRESLADPVAAEAGAAQTVAYSIRTVKEAAGDAVEWLRGQEEWEHVLLMPDGSIAARCKAVEEQALVQCLRKLCEAQPVLEMSRPRLNLEETFVNILQNQK